MKKIQVRRTYSLPPSVAKWIEKTAKLECRSASSFVANAISNLMKVEKE